MSRFLISRRNMMKTTVLALAATSVGSRAFAETTLEKAKAAGYIRIGFANEAPFGFATPDG